MARVKRGVTAHAKHKKVLKQAKGFYGRRSNTIRIAKQAVERANQYAYRDRRRRKRNFRALWIQRINAAAREQGLTYGRLIDGLLKAGVEVDRKVLSDLAIHEPEAFAAIVAQAKAALAYLKDATPNEFEAAVRACARAETTGGPPALRSPFRVRARTAHPLPERLRCTGSRQTSCAAAGTSRSPAAISRRARSPGGPSPANRW